MLETADEDVLMDEAVPGVFETILANNSRQLKSHIEPANAPGKASGSTVKLAQSLKDGTDTALALHQVLSAPVQLTVSEVLGLAPRLHKAFFTDLPQDSQALVKASSGIQGEVGKIRALVENSAYQYTAPKSLVVTKKNDSLYVSATLKFTVRVGEIGIRAIIDTGAEINVITQDLAQELGLLLMKKLDALDAELKKRGEVDEDEVLAYNERVRLKNDKKHGVLAGARHRATISKIWGKEALASLYLFLNRGKHRDLCLRTTNIEKAKAMDTTIKVTAERLASLGLEYDSYEFLKRRGEAGWFDGGRREQLLELCDGEESLRQSAEFDENAEGRASLPATIAKSRAHKSLTDCRCACLSPALCGKIALAARSDSISYAVIEQLGFQKSFVKMCDPHLHLVAGLIGMRCNITQMELTARLTWVVAHHGLGNARRDGANYFHFAANKCPATTESQSLRVKEVESSGPPTKKTKVRFYIPVFAPLVPRVPKEAMLTRKTLTAALTRNGLRLKETGGDKSAEIRGVYSWAETIFIDTPIKKLSIAECARVVYKLHHHYLKAKPFFTLSQRFFRAGPLVYALNVITYNGKLQFISYPDSLWQARAKDEGNGIAIATVEDETFVDDISVGGVRFAPCLSVIEGDFCTVDKQQQ
ncbi:hypothetical protein KEM52_001694 [Ascosphaera acerosa]|nr:hypothetical protein KEM52_001694 [Ascosphaera acerosa]